MEKTMTNELDSSSLLLKNIRSFLKRTKQNTKKRVSPIKQQIMIKKEAQHHKTLKESDLDYNTACYLKLERNLKELRTVLKEERSKEFTLVNNQFDFIRSEILNSTKNETELNWILNYLNTKNRFFMLSNSDKSFLIWKLEEIIEDENDRMFNYSFNLQKQISKFHKQYKKYVYSFE